MDEQFGLSLLSYEFLKRVQRELWAEFLEMGDFAHANYFRLLRRINGS